MANPIRLLIVEDNADLSANLAEFFDSEAYILDFAHDGLVALHLLATNTYDVIVLDVMLPGVSGFSLCQRIRQDLGSSTPIIMMTAKDQIEDKAEAFEEGADDYLVKPFHLRELALRIQALHRRHTMPSRVLVAGVLQYAPDTLSCHVGGKSITLTGRSADILHLLVQAYPKMVSYDQLSQLLWAEKEVEAQTLRTHVYLLRKQLQDAFGSAMIKTIHGRGYRLDPPQA